MLTDGNHCGGLKSCVRCDKGGGTTVVGESWNTSTTQVEGSSYRCLKCTHLIVFRTRECVDKCPSGYSEEWSTVVDYIGRVCKGRYSRFVSQEYLLVHLRWVFAHCKVVTLRMYFRV